MGLGLRTIWRVEAVQGWGLGRFGGLELLRVEV